jgi:hypothetical protein
MITDDIYTAAYPLHEVSNLSVCFFLYLTLRS